MSEDSGVAINQKSKRQFMFEDMAEHFAKRWGPEDRDDMCRFNAELFSIIRQIYHDVQEPVQKTLTEVLMAGSRIAGPPFLVKDNKE